MGLRFNSPTVNMYFDAEDFIKFLESLEDYLIKPITFLYIHEKGYPVCAIDDIKIYAVHYKDFKEVKGKWEQRKKRINFDNLFIIMTDRDGMNDSLVERLSKIPYRKVLFSHKCYPEYDFVIYIEEFNNNGQVGELHRFIDIKGTRHYENYFDFVEWLNGD